MSAQPVADTSPTDGSGPALLPVVGVAAIVGLGLVLLLFRRPRRRGGHARHGRRALT
ncbi:MAG: LPXTG cell wall anchor domain-containing protein [Pseudorhodobacter sp.]|nr:LPXTG cell wall anchor domain-containing protein [Frankiaceae bacterium]